MSRAGVRSGSRWGTSMVAAASRTLRPGPVTIGVIGAVDGRVRPGIGTFRVGPVGEVAADPVGLVLDEGERVPARGALRQGQGDPPVEPRDAQATAGAPAPKA